MTWSHIFSPVWSYLGWENCENKKFIAHIRNWRNHGRRRRRKKLILRPLRCTRSTIIIFFSFYILFSLWMKLPNTPVSYVMPNSILKKMSIIPFTLLTSTLITKPKFLKIGKNAQYVVSMYPVSNYTRRKIAFRNC